MIDYSVPPVIDVAYVERVMEALDRVYGDAIRTLARERKITQEFLERLAAIYGEGQFDRTQAIWVRDVASGLSGLAPTPGDPRTVIQEVMRGEPSCVVLRVDRDFSATHAGPDAASPQEFVGLIPKPLARDPK
ncbi:MAG TPA: hypothetical protein VHH53_02435, partial [Pseudonocardiaceae bacterium]|nr:hypothetical protein [Pseudonocardiaceae bacterium]